MQEIEMEVEEQDQPSEQATPAAGAGERRGDKTKQVRGGPLKRTYHFWHWRAFSLLRVPSVRWSLQLRGPSERKGKPYMLLDPFSIVEEKLSAKDKMARPKVSYIVFNKKGFYKLSCRGVCSNWSGF